MDDTKEFTAAAKLSDATITAGGSGTLTADASATLPWDRKQFWGQVQALHLS